MTEGQKAVVRFLDGTVMKGYLEGFTEDAAEITLRTYPAETLHRVSADRLKAVFFVKTFEGDSQYNEKKSYGIRKQKGRRTFVKFTDGEDMVGFLEGEVPWEKGFFLARKKLQNLKGFYLLPADGSSNNNRVFVFTSAIRDVTVVP